MVRTCSSDPSRPAANREGNGEHGEPVPASKQGYSGDPGSRAEGEQSQGGAAPRDPALTLCGSGGDREPADLSDVLSTWAWVFISLIIYTRLAIYTWLAFVTHLIFPLPYVIFSALFNFCFLGWRHHKILATPWKHQLSHFPQLHVQEQREFLVQGAGPSATYYAIKTH